MTAPDPAPVTIARGDGPLVLGMPHSGRWLPGEIFERLNNVGRTLSDTDWHVDRLYDGLVPDVTIVHANFHRYAIDANRDPSGKSLYPGQNTTGLIPETDFDARNIWSTPPDDQDIADRLTAFHAPYHRALRIELERVRDRHGVAILYDCHSIRSRIPNLFDARLPDFNIGTNDGQTCDRRIETAVAEICAGADGYSTVLNGRFKGGWTTRHYGQPDTGIHAIQMELTQSSYLTEETEPWAYDDEKAEKLRHHLGRILQELTRLAPQLTGAS